MRSLLALPLALVLIFAPGPAARADEKPPTPSEVRSRIANLEVDAADGMIARLKALAKTADDRREIAALDRELGLARRIEVVAKLKIPELVKQSKPRDAWALALATAAQFPDAISLAALMKRARSARDQAFFAIDDFDRSPIPRGQPQESQEKGKDIGNLRLSDSRVEIVDDGLGGRALRWTWDAAGPHQLPVIEWALKQRADLDGFEYACFRARVPKGPVKPLSVRFIGESDDDHGAFDVTLSAAPGAGGTWKEYRVPLAALARRGAFDPHAVRRIAILCTATTPAEVVLDEFLLARRAR